MGMFTLLFVLFLVPFLSGIFVLRIKPAITKNIKFILSFSGAYLISITTLKLLPDVFNYNNYSNVGIFILLGFFIQLALEVISQGIEHGHLHNYNDKSKNIKGTFLIILSLMIHSFIEGLPFNEHNPVFKNENMLFSPVLMGILLHKIPVAIVFSFFLTLNKFTIKKSIILLAIFSFMSPFSVILSQYLNLYINDLNQFYNSLTAILIGIFLHVSTTIIFESSDSHKITIMKLLSIVSAILLALLI